MQPDDVRAALIEAGLCVLHVTTLRGGGVLAYLHRRGWDDITEATVAVARLDPDAVVTYTGDASSIMQIRPSR